MGAERQPSIIRHAERRVELHDLLLRRLSEALGHLEQLDTEDAYRKGLCEDAIQGAAYRLQQLRDLEVLGVDRV